MSTYVFLLMQSVKAGAVSSLADVPTEAQINKDLKTPAFQLSNNEFLVIISPIRGQKLQSQLLLSFLFLLSL